MGDIVGFLRAHPPFAALDAAELAALAAVAEPEEHPAGATILAKGGPPVTHVRVVRTGAVEIVLDGRILDLLGPGELFGHASMLSGLPLGFAAVAVGATTCLRIPADAMRPVLGRPAGLRYVTRSLMSSALLDPAGTEDRAADSAQRPVRELLRTPLVRASPALPIREAAQRMTACRASALVVPLDGGRLGILTDHDLRRVIADGVDTAAPVSAAMSAPAWTVAADRLGGEVLLDMLDRGVRHAPVLDATGEVLGVLADVDVVAATTRSSFGLRAAIARAGSVPELVTAAAGLTPTVIALHDARVAATDIAGITSVVVDALTRRLIELVAPGPPPRPLTWLALGSLARREAVPSSDVDSALVWAGDGQGRADNAAEYAHALAEQVLAGLAACGFRADANGAVATNKLFARSYDGWVAAARSWLADPTQERAPILVSLAVDARPVWGVRAGPSVADVFRDARRHPDLLRLLGRYALAHRPPTGFLRDFVVEHSGRRRGKLDLKRGGLVPIVDLARWAGMAAGVTSASTPARLRAAAAAGTLDAGPAATLEEAFHLVLQLRMAHQVEQLRAGAEPDDLVRPADLSPVTRVSLREAFRTVATVQRRIDRELQLGVR
ncbi:cyclic nucleotide-binding domain-containing protein [Pseudonocardia sp. DSM 110487]|uniref:putative nucleotidyltransferase substrate binding domain-containing protein n=1 Tax=Pseudonocardia sp. DSM 110487 TaxID=2865833 RepID=UPI001C69BB88|nr:putative nucleotidyltransferase substrate binding domain-containing protein [Pseudonocardia sp. DSM 110487]QYN38182.1 cyclic nucleotide-binding domain-containing protein [Pseudonocardia sp. DSM 110487]